MNFYERLYKTKFNLTIEIFKIEDLFSGNLKKFLEANFNLLSSKIRCNEIYIQNLINKTNAKNKLNSYSYLRSCYIENMNVQDIISFDDFKEYCECIMTIFYNFLKIAKKYINENFSEMKTITDNIKFVLEKLNHEIKYINDICYIVEIDYKVTQAAEIIDNEYDLGNQLYKYNHSSLKGDLNSKSDILCRLYKYYEKNEKELPNNDKFIKKITCLSNKTNTRHAPNKERYIIDNKTDEEMEELLDTLFNAYLIFIIAVAYHKKYKSKLDKYYQEFTNMENKGN